MYVCMCARAGAGWRACVSVVVGGGRTEEWQEGQKPYKGEILVGFEEKSFFQSVYPSNNLANSHK